MLTTSVQLVEDYPTQAGIFLFSFNWTYYITFHYDLRKNSFAPRIASIWNSLANDVVMDSVQLVKSRLPDWIRSEVNNGLDETGKRP